MRQPKHKHDQGYTAKKQERIRVVFYKHNPILSHGRSKKNIIERGQNRQRIERSSQNTHGQAHDQHKTLSIRRINKQERRGTPCQAKQQPAEHKQSNPDNASMFCPVCFIIMGNQQHNDGYKHIKTNPAQKKHMIL